jgi:predicted amidohydrolase YtcJ
MTMDAAAPQADTLYVQDGKIAWVGMAAAQPEGLLNEQPKLRRIDLQGKTVLPWLC